MVFSFLLTSIIAFIARITSTKKNWWYFSLIGPILIRMKYVVLMQPRPFLKISVSKKKPGKVSFEYGYMDVLYSVRSEHADAIEDVVHEALKSMRSGPQQFDISLEDAIKAIEAAVKRFEHPETPRSLREVVVQLQGDQTRQSFAKELGTTYDRVREWIRHDTLPSPHWDKVLMIAAKRKRSDITWELLKKLYLEHKRKKP